MSAHPTAEWTTQQFPEILSDPHQYNSSLTTGIPFLRNRSMGPEEFWRAPSEEAGSSVHDECALRKARRHIPRECFDCLVFIDDRHLRLISRVHVPYNRGRLHSAVRHGIPEPIQAIVLGSVGKFQTVIELPRSQFSEDYTTKCSLEKEAAYRRRTLHGAHPPFRKYSGFLC